MNLASFLYGAATLLILESIIIILFAILVRTIINRHVRNSLRRINLRIQETQSGHSQDNSQPQPHRFKL